MINTNQGVKQNNKRESISLKHQSYQTINVCDIYESIQNYNPKKKHKILILFDDMIADMRSNKKLQSIVTKTFTEQKTVTKNCRFLLFLKHQVNVTHYFIKNI